MIKNGEDPIKQLVPGIINAQERKEIPAMVAAKNQHESQLMNERLYWRVLEK